MYKSVNEVTGSQIRILLTDYFPNLAAFKALVQSHGGVFEYCESPVSALEVPNHLTGFRTLFSSFHHFAPKEAVDVLSDAVNQRQGIAVVESTQRHLLLIMYMMLI